MTHPIVVTVICDGHRPDFVSAETTPHMARLRRAGTWFADHRAVLPDMRQEAQRRAAATAWSHYEEQVYGAVHAAVAVGPC